MDGLLIAAWYSFARQTPPSQLTLSKGSCIRCERPALLLLLGAEGARGNLFKLAGSKQMGQDWTSGQGGVAAYLPDCRLTHAGVHRRRLRGSHWMLGYFLAPAYGTGPCCASLCAQIKEKGQKGFPFSAKEGV